MMRTLIVLTCTTFVAVAHAQTSDERQRGVNALMSYCLVSPRTRSLPDRQAWCACTAAGIAARSTDRQLGALARLLPLAPDVEAGSREVGRMAEEGYTRDEIGEIADLVEQSAAGTDAACAGAASGDSNS